MKIYTRTGDQGETGLLGGARVSKASLRVAAYGDIDELGAVLGIALTQVDTAMGADHGAGDAGHTAAGAAPSLKSLEIISRWILSIQRELFVVGAELATPPGTPPSLVQSEHAIGKVEHAIDELEAELPPLTNFIVPGGALPAATLHLARTVCRRAERVAVTLNEIEPLRPDLVRYLNRLSDLLFVLARSTNAALGKIESIWEGSASDDATPGH